MADLPSTAARRLAGAQVLVLDNCEHVAERVRRARREAARGLPDADRHRDEPPRARRRRASASSVSPGSGSRRATTADRPTPPRCSSPARASRHPPSTRSPRRFPASSSCAGAWMASLWPSSWPPPGSACSRSTRSPSESSATSRSCASRGSGADRPPHPAGDLRLQPRAADALRSGAVAPPVRLRSELRAARGGGRRRWRRARPRRGPRRARRARRQVAGDDRGATAPDPVPAARHASPVRRRAARDERRGAGRAARPRRLPR